MHSGLEGSCVLTLWQRVGSYSLVFGGVGDV